MCIDFRQRGGRRERDRNIIVGEKHGLVASCMHPNWGWNLQPRYVPRPGIELTVFWYMGECSNQPNQLARACIS